MVFSIGRTHRVLWSLYKESFRFLYLNVWFIGLFDGEEGFTGKKWIGEQKEGVDVKCRREGDFFSLIPFILDFF